MTTLVEVLAEVPFPVYGIRPIHWSGPSYVGDITRVGGRITHVSLVYQHEQDLASAVCVSSLDPGAGTEPLGAHLGAFVARFDPAFMRKHNKPRKPPFSEGAFKSQQIVVMIGGQNAGAHTMRHAILPLELLRAPLRSGNAVVDVGLAGWRADVRDLASLVERVDAPFAREMDKANQTAYPYSVEDPPHP